VPLAEDGGADRNDLADDGLGRPAPVLDDGEDLGDRDPADQRERGRLRCRTGRGRPPRRGLVLVTPNTTPKAGKKQSTRPSKSSAAPTDAPAQGTGTQTRPPRRPTGRQ